MRCILLLTVAMLTSCGLSAQEIVNNSDRAKADRKPFQRSNAVLKAPTKYEMRETAQGTYDPKPRIITIDEKAGKYELRWIGYDGKEKIVAYQRWDALDAFVEARVERSGPNYLYRYLIRNQPSSPGYVGSFIVQTFTKDVKQEHIPAGEELDIGHMANYIPQFSQGVWRVFAPLGEVNWILPGSEREFKITSQGPPGVVDCYARAGGPSLEGVGEHMPSELEMAMPGFDELASCLTIGPNDRLAELSNADRAKYLLENLPKFVEAGWMSDGTAKNYEAILKREDLGGALEKAKKDLENEFITSEVFHIIEGLNQ